MHARDRQAPHAALTEVRLHGHLGRRFGRVFRLAVGSPAEAVRALCCVVPGFRTYVAEKSVPGYRVFTDREQVLPEQIHAPTGRRAIRIVPVVAGAKSKFAGIILGVGLIALSFVPGLQGTLFTVGATNYSVASIAMSFGVSMVLGGVAGLLTPSPSASPTAQERPDNLPSYAFNGAVNTVGQGGPVQIVYGRAIVGSQVISAGLAAEPV